jgi:hypothetical protein
MFRVPWANFGFWGINFGPSSEITYRLQSDIGYNQCVIPDLGPKTIRHGAWPNTPRQFGGQVGAISEDTGGQHDFSRNSPIKFQVRRTIYQVNMHPFTSPCGDKLADATICKFIGKGE